MSLSLVTVTGSWVVGSNTTPNGTVIFQPVMAATGGGYIMAGAPIPASLVAGAINIQLVNNAQMTSLQYQVTEHIDASPIVTYVITPTGASLDLSTAPRGTGQTVPTYVLQSQIGAVDGVCPLDDTSHVPSQYLPSGSGVLSVAADNTNTVAVSGSAANPLLGVATIPESKVTGLVADLAAINTSLGSKAAKPVFRRAYVTSGDTTLPSTGAGWTAVSGFELDIPAAVGDTVEVAWSAMRSPNTSAFLDVAVISGAGPAIQRYMATGSSTPALEGDPDWYTQSTFIGHAGPHSFVVTSGDLDTGNVRIALVCKSNGTGTVYSSSNYPFYWQLINWGVVG